MSSTRLASAVAQLYDAAKMPELWPAALQHVAEMAGGVGVGHVVHNKRTGTTEWVSVTGPCAELESRYINFYASRDLFAPVLFAAATGHWLPLSRTISKSDIRHNDWYNDFIIR